MSFNGTPVIEQISPTELRITGVTLSLQTSGTIGFSTATGAEPDIRLPAQFPVPSSSFLGEPRSLGALVKVDIEPGLTDLVSSPFTNLPPSVTKTGETGEDFRIKVTNTKVDLTTQILEIYLTLLGQAPSGVSVVVTDSPNAHVEVTL